MVPQPGGANLPAHFDPSLRGGLSTPPAYARPSQRPEGSAFPLPLEDDLFADAGPPPHLAFACAYLGAPLVLATLVVAALALR
jgi:hypothetical protein